MPGIINPCGGCYSTVQDEGVALPKERILDFVGAGVTAADDPGSSRTTVTIPGATSGGGINALANGLGLLAWSADPADCDQTFRPSTTTVLAPVWLAAGTTVTSIGTLHPTIEVVAPTHAYKAIYDASFALVGITADLPSPVAVGWNVWALTATYLTPADGLYYLGALYTPATQTPTSVSTAINYGVPPALPGGLYRTPRVSAPVTFPNPFVPTSTSPNTPLIVAI